jgi:transposase
MPRPLSNDLRKRILAVKEEGASHARIAREMRVSVSAITRLLALVRETGSCEARARKAGCKPRLDGESPSSGCHRPSLQFYFLIRYCRLVQT